MPPHRRITLAIMAALGAGVLGASVAVFLVAGSAALQTTTCESVHLVHDQGFDPWTGLPEGKLIESTCLGQPMVFADPVPADLAGRHGVPWGTFLTIAASATGLLIAVRWTRPEALDDA